MLPVKFDFRLNFFQPRLILKETKEVEKQLAIMDKSPWDSNAIFIFFCHFSVPS